MPHRPPRDNPAAAPPRRRVALTPRRAALAALTLTLIASAVATGLALAQVNGQAGHTPNDRRIDHQVDNQVDTRLDPNANATPTPPAKPQGTPPPTLNELNGYDAAFRRMGTRMPMGHGFVVAQTEGHPGRYRPDTEQPFFNGVEFIAHGPASPPFNHATATARRVVSPQGVARGVKRMHSYPVNVFFTEYLRVNSDKPPLGPDQSDIDVFYHAWIGNQAQGVEDALLRTDYQIDDRGVIMCVGVNNRANSQVPILMAHAYNAIAVGTAKRGGESSGGYTRLDGPGRCKPDIVGPRMLTSFTTPMVAGAATLLLDMAQRHEVTEQRLAAARPETVKAVLLAGATKPDHWRPKPGKPLDEHLGAGVLNIDHSLRISEQPLTPPDEDTAVGEFGWSYHAVPLKQAAAYRLSVPSPGRHDLSVALAWNRKVDPAMLTRLRTGQSRWLGLPMLTDYNLTLVRLDTDAADATDAPDAARPAQPVAASRSKVDNVEYLYLKDLPAGEYRLVVDRAPGPGENGEITLWPYALAWRMHDKPQRAYNDPASPAQHPDRADASVTDADENEPEIAAEDFDITPDPDPDADH